MSLNDQVKVALFIDWDNLAISTAADLSGANPDVRAIVQRAQQYGTLIIAKAYAEWQANSERLTVYRAGIEPVYAPTFRFEPDTATQQGKGKSLADPCMVADCVDALHLFPDISVYVLVTGDKDLIPVVRLAQLRGRRVVVIGPDYVAGVLREMADDFVPYRSLVEGAPARPELRRYGSHVATGEESTRRRGERHPTSAFVRQEKLAAASAAVAAIPPVMPAPMPPVAAPPQAVPIPPITPVAPRSRVAPEPIVAEAAPEERPADDIRAVFDTIVQILQQRYDEGRDRIRATNLKDSLMQRMPGFSERRYGFGKFKDLLSAAEKSSLLRVTVAGPVHWISLPEVEHAPAAVVAETPAAPQVSVAPPVISPTVLPMETMTGAEVVPPVPVEERQNEMISFIHELRHRSRWLTYTYVLTNLISHFARSLSQNAAEAQARATLNHLVQQGVLRVDKEPQEVEVGGAKHRVRMCHLNLSHPVVVEALGDTGEDAAAAAAEERQEARTEQSEPVIGEATWLPAEVTAAEETPSEPEGPSAPLAPEPVAWGRGEAATPAAQTDEPERGGPEQQSSVPYLVDGLLKGNGALAEGMPSTTDETARPGEGYNGGESGPAPRHAETAEASTGTPEASETGAESAPAAEAPESPETKRERAYAVLAQVVRAGTNAQKPMISASAVRTRMTNLLGSFNERDYGVTRFKDFLMAAQNAGVVQIEIRGHVPMVRPPQRSDELPAGSSEDR